MNCAIMKVMSLPVYPAADTTSSARTITLAITGASGIVFARHMLQCLEADPRIAHIYLVASPSSLRVLAEEDGVIAKNNLAEKLLGRASEKIQHLAHEDIGAPIASGSCPVSAMIILPCSMGTLGGIAHGLAANLIERAADVCLKERRPLILCVRETPFNRIHLRNMQLAADAGATIFPVMPTLYSKPQSTSEMAIQFVQRVLAHIGLAQPGAYQWQADGRPD